MTEETQPESVAEAPASTAPRQRSWAVPLALLAVLIAAGLAALVWIDARERIGATQEETARRLREVETAAQEARQAARQAAEGLREAQAKSAKLEAELAQSRSEQLSIEALYQELARNRDEWLLAEIEHVLSIASQQLRLAGNVRGALLALEFADSRLAGAERPQFQTLRRALARDIERLRALPSVDYPALSLRLEGLVAAVEDLPLGYEMRAERPGEARTSAEPEASVWRRLAQEVWSELRQLVTVRRIEGPEPALLTPTQAYFLRENLRLRLLSARLSLLARDEAGYRESLRVARDWIQRYFDARAKPTAEALAELQQLAAVTLSFQVPAISESLEAVRSFKARRERGAE